jgi:acyl carrier protein
MAAPPATACVGPAATVIELVPNVARPTIWRNGMERPLRTAGWDVVPYHDPTAGAHVCAMEGLKEPDILTQDDADDDDGGEYAMWLVVVRALRRVFPYVDIEEINRFEPLQDELDLNSSDFVQLMAAVTEQTGLVVAEQDYPIVSTLDGLEHYLKSRVMSLTS